MSSGGGVFPDPVDILQTYTIFFQAEEGEKTCNVEQETEKRVLEEFGRCLAQIIEFSGKFKKTSSLLQ